MDITKGHFKLISCNKLGRVVIYPAQYLILLCSIIAIKLTGNKGLVCLCHALHEQNCEWGVPHNLDNVQKFALERCRNGAVLHAGWVNDVATGAKAAITGTDWLAMALICFILPAILSWAIGLVCRRIGWIREGDLKL